MARGPGWAARRPWRGLRRAGPRRRQLIGGRRVQSRSVSRTAAVRALPARRPAGPRPPAPAAAPPAAALSGPRSVPSLRPQPVSPAQDAEADTRPPVRTVPAAEPRPTARGSPRPPAPAPRSPVCPAFSWKGEPRTEACGGLGKRGGRGTEPAPPFTRCSTQTQVKRPHCVQDERLGTAGPASGGPAGRCLGSDGPGPALWSLQGPGGRTRVGNCPGGSQEDHSDGLFPNQPRWQPVGGGGNCYC